MVSFKSSGLPVPPNSHMSTSPSPLPPVLLAIEWGSVAEWVAGIATFFAVLLALFGPSVHSAMTRASPRLAVDKWMLARRERFSHKVDPQTGRDITVSIDPVIFVYLPVVNESPSRPALNTRVLLRRFQRTSNDIARYVDRSMTYSIHFIWSPACEGARFLDVYHGESIDFGSFHSELIVARSYFMPALLKPPLGEDFSVRVNEQGVYWLETVCSNSKKREFVAVSVQWDGTGGADEDAARKSIRIEQKRSKNHHA